MKKTKANRNLKDIVENIKWFSKFSLEKRLRLSEEDAKAIETLRNLRIEGYDKLKRAH